MIFAVFLVLSGLTADLGRALKVSAPNETGIKSVRIEWQSKNIPLVLVKDAWLTVIGVDLDVKPGEHAATIVVTMHDGRIERRPFPITVNAVRYPTTELNVADEFVQLNPANQARSAKETAEINAIYGAITPEILWTKPFVIPVPGRTGTNFGHRRVFNGEARSPHSGADLRASTGTPIHATNRGRVALARNLFFTGNTVIVDHGLGIYSLYAHLSRIDVKKGEVVEHNQIVGLAGATGRVTGPHLHWGVRVQGARVDPFSLLEL